METIKQSINGCPTPSDGARGGESSETTERKRVIPEHEIESGKQLNIELK